MQFGEHSFYLLAQPPFTCDFAYQLPSLHCRSVDLRASTYSSAGLTDLKNGIKTALGAQIGGNFGGFDNGLGNTGGLNAFGTAAGLGGLGAVGAGLALGLAKASKTKGKEGISVRPSLLQGL